jgi:hypothetical protein
MSKKKWSGDNLSSDVVDAIGRAIANGVRKEEASWIPMQDPDVSKCWDRQAKAIAKMPKEVRDALDWPGDMADPSDDEFMKLYDDDFLEKLYDQLGVTPDEE